MSGTKTKLVNLGNSFEALKKIMFKMPDQQFDIAIKAGHLSLDKNADNYVGQFMYMGEQDGVIMFKNINTRSYHNFNIKP